MKSAFLRLLVTSCVVAVASSCTLLLDTPAEVQCATSGDCTARGGDFAFSVCGPRNVCVKPADYCETDQQCLDANGGKPFVCDGATRRCVEGCISTEQCLATHGNQPFVCHERKCVPGCTSNKQCNDTYGGSVAKPYWCRRPDVVPQCVPLLREETDVCPQILLRTPDDLLNDDVYWVGLVASQAGSTPALGPGQIEGAYLALQEWMRSGGGLTMGHKKRPVGFINCDNNVNPILALDHLTQDVRVKAIIGPSNSGVFGTNGPTHIQSRKVVAMTGAGGGADLSVLENSDGFLWRTQPADADYLSAMPAFVAEFEKQIRTKLGMGSGDKIRIIVANTSDRLGTSGGEQLTKELVFNGQSALAQLDVSYKNINYGNTTTDADTVQKQAAAAQAILDMKPHLVYYAGRAESFNIMKLVELGWTDATFRPMHVLATTQFNSSSSNFVNGFTDPNRPNTAAVRDDLRQRIVGPTPTSTNPVQAQLYKSRHIAEFVGSYVHQSLPNAPKAVGPTLFSMAYYDAVYTIFSALIATQKEDPTGEEIRDAIAKTQPAAGLAPLDIQPDAIGSLTKTLSGGGRVDLNGILSDLNFKRNSVSTNVAFWCMPKTPGTPGQAQVPVESGLTYDAANKSLKGTLPVQLKFDRCENP